MNRPAHLGGTSRLTLALATLAVLAGCSSLRSDGPPTNPPPDLAQVPDADPRLEPIRDGGPNKPYEVMGHLYTPIREDKPFNERGLASWYGRKFQGKRTASGEPYDPFAMTAAHPTLPIPSYARVRNPKNGREVVVRINDRGPFHSSRIIDLSYTAALKLGVLNGVAPVELTRITFEDIRTGAWRRPGSVDPAVAAVASASPAGVSATPAPTPAPSSTANVGSPLPDAPLPAPAPVPSDVPVATISLAEVVALPATAASSPSVAAGGVWVQLGAFKQKSGAESFYRRVAADLAWLAPVLTVAADGGLFRLQAGPYADRDQAQDVSQRIRDSLRLVPVIVDRR